MRQELCPGYFERDVQEVIDKNGPKFTRYFCALCGQQVRPVNKGFRLGRCIESVD